MIGPHGKAGGTGLIQIGRKGIVDMIAAFRRLYDGKGHVIRRDATPVDLSLMMGNIDSAHRILLPIRRESREVQVACSSEGA